MSFGILLVVYLGVFALLINRLKRFFPQFYLRERKQIFITSSAVIISILTRIFMGFLYSVPSIAHEFDESTLHDTWLFPFATFLTLFVASLFPIASIIYSLMYAITHKKRMIRRSVQNRTSNQQQTVQSLLREEDDNDDDGS